MTFPTISYKYNDVENADALATLMDQKLEPLGRMIKDGIEAGCEVEFERVAAQQHGKIHRVEANLVVNGTLHRAEATEETFEQAIDEVRAELNKKLRRSKDKQDSLMKRAGKRIKDRLSLRQGE